MNRVGWRIGEVDRFEVNEAFAAIAIVVRDELRIDPARLRTDIQSAQTGAILITKVGHALQRTG